MKKIAVITGASSGMGRRFAETVTEWGSFDEVWAIARRADRLEELGLLNDEAYAAYTEGMRMVATDGTAARFFRDYPIAIAAKTGTAQRGEHLANNACFICFAPYDDPEIAMAVVVEKGGAGAALASTAVEIINAYFTNSGVGGVIPENTL